MKKTIILIAAILYSIGASSQNIGRDQLGNGFILTKEKELGVEGTPYLNETFLKGEIVVEDKGPLEVYLRYNVLDEEMEIKIDREDPEIFKFQTTKSTQYVIGDRKFISESISVDGERIEGYFEDLYSGENLRLFRKAIASVSEPRPAKSSYEMDKPGRIAIDEKFFVSFNGGKTAEVELKERELKKIFDSKEARDYFSDNKIKTLEDLISFVKFYDTL